MQSILITGGNLEKRKEKAKQLSVVSYQLSVVDTLIIRGNNWIGIDKVRELEQWASRKPHSSKFKSAIIYEAEKLTHQAQNALLKTLEEPPKNTLIILTAPQETFLLPTIVSRCKVIKLKSEAQIKFEQSTIPAKGWSACGENNQSRQSRGFSIKASGLSTINHLLSAKVGNRIKKAQEIAKTREETIIFLNQLIFLLRELLLKKQQVSPMQAIASIRDVPDFPNRACWQIDILDLTKILRKALKTKAMIEKNVNTKLALENFFLDLPLLE